MSTKPYYTPPQLAKLLDLTPRTIVNWCQTARIPAYRIGRAWRIRAADAEPLLKAQKGEK